jgi:hypothetical protein
MGWDPRILIPDFGGARDVATIEEILIEAAEGAKPKRAVGVAEFH